RGRDAPESWTVDLRALRPEAQRVARGAGVLRRVEAERLARLVQRIEWALGDGQGPQDVEWVLDREDRLWIVQARPVTGLAHHTLPGVRHLPAIWSSANVGDTSPEVLRPLAWSLRKRTLDRFLFMPFEAAGCKFPHGLVATRLIEGRVRIDLTQWQWASYDSLGVMPAELNQLIGGHHPTLAVPPESPFRGLSGLRRIRGLMRLVRAGRRAARGFLRDCASLRIEARRLALEDLRNHSLEDLRARGLRLFEMSIGFGRRYMVAGAGGATVLLTRLLRRHLGDEHTGVATGLLTGCGEMTGIDCGLRLRDLAQVARESHASRDCVLGKKRDWMSLPESDPFRRGFERFLDEFGHRAVHESDISRARWREDPSYPLAQIRAYLEKPPERDPFASARDARRAAEARLRSLPVRARLKARWLARRARAGSLRRQCGKSTLVAIMEAVRLLVIEIGRRLEKEDSIETVDEVFDLSWPDLEAFVRGEWNGHGARALCADRRAQCDAWRAHKPREVIILDPAGREVAFPTAFRATHPATDTANSGRPLLAGIGASAGRASGRARLVRRPEDGVRLVDGEILVAPSTDPSWTPLFFRAAALVTAMGGNLSHGSILARECGLPAVVNVPGAMEKLVDGQQILVDGDRGEIRVLETQ
ncbi:MAG: PEP-utilizing enzyme, partial [Planctomycetota bacterium]